MFDKLKFSDLLVEIQGKRSINAYARDSGVSAAYISKLQRGMYDKAPSPEILRKLAGRGEDEVKYKELMVAAGHLLPFEKDTSLKIKQLYLLAASDSPEGFSRQEDALFSEYLTPEERSELDEFIKNSTEEEILKFSNSLTAMNNLYSLSQLSRGTEEPRVAENLIVYSQETVKIPVLGKIACGDPILVEENYESYHTVLKEGLPSGNLVYLEAKGDSMDPTIPDGSFVLIREQPEVETGEIAAVMFNGTTEATLKRVKRQGDMLLLIPDNPSYPPVVVTEDNPVKIIGKAMEVTRKL